MKGVENTIEKIPGLSSLVEKMTNSVNAFVFTTIEPMLKPIMGAPYAHTVVNGFVADPARHCRSQVRRHRSSRRARRPSSTTPSRCAASTTHEARAEAETDDVRLAHAVRGVHQPARQRPESLVPQQGPVRLSCYLCRCSTPTDTTSAPAALPSSSTSLRARSPSSSCPTRSSSSSRRGRRTAWTRRTWRARS